MSTTFERSRRILRVLAVLIAVMAVCVATSAAKRHGPVAHAAWIQVGPCQLHAWPVVRASGTRWQLKAHGALDHCSGKLFSCGHHNALDVMVQVQGHGGRWWTKPDTKTRWPQSGTICNYGMSEYSVPTYDATQGHVYRTLACGLSDGHSGCLPSAWWRNR